MLTDSRRRISGQKRRTRSVHILDELWTEAQALVERGEYANVSHLTEEAVKRLLESHKTKDQKS